MFDTFQEEKKKKKKKKRGFGRRRQTKDDLDDMDPENLFPEVRDSRTKSRESNKYYFLHDHGYTEEMRKFNHYEVLNNKF